MGGIVGQSFALISDAVNSIGDSLGSVIVLFALRVAQRPPDPDHPYGHTRAEAVAGLSVAWLIAFSAVLVGWEAVAHLFDKHSSPAAWTLWIAAANVVIKEAAVPRQHARSASGSARSRSWRTPGTIAATRSVRWRW